MDKREKNAKKRGGRPYINFLRKNPPFSSRGKKHRGLKIRPSPFPPCGIILSLKPPQEKNSRNSHQTLFILSPPGKNIPPLKNVNWDANLAGLQKGLLFPGQLEFPPPRGILEDPPGFSRNPRNKKF